MTHISKFEKATRSLNLWKSDGKWFRLFANGVTPNGCWLINPKMINLVSIDIETGNDLYSDIIIELDMSTVNSSFVFNK